ncbi:Rab3 GTPase-activating protein catalytic subunit-domain-containing protein [Umbelopsis sp. AD052]|nr:Rab3 GTPase-activating protein catalytic subunit-domain-containing protein [Umbelopsis sp. AD052]
MATSTKSRRENSTNSEELFEFVDYTSASNFERLANAVEEILSLWGLKDSDHGITSDSVPETAPSIDQAFRKESMSIEDTTYNLMYHCDPKLIEKHHDPINAPFVAEALTSAVTDQGDKETNFHALHRWTGIARLLVLEVTSDSLRSRLFASGKATVDINQAKLLLSACRIAIHNTACKIPIFIRCGSARHGLFIGYSLSKDQNQDITETNFNTMVVPSLPSTWSDLDIVRRVLRKKLEIDEYDGDLDIQATAAFTYSLKNWFDEDWKSWNDEGDESEDDSTNVSNSNDLLERNFDDVSTKKKAKPASSLPHLDFGSYNDPLRSLNLTAIFPMTNLNTFLENQFSSDMDAVVSPVWRVATEFAPDAQQRAVLSTSIDDAIASWIKDPANKEYLAPYDDSNNSNEDSSQRSRLSRDPKRLRNLLQSGRSSTDVAMPGSLGGGKDNGGAANVTFVASDEVESVLHALFEANLEAEHSNRHYYGETFENLSTSDTSLPTVRSLGFHVKEDQLVPYKSFLWNLLVLALNAATSSNKTANTSFISFLKILWSEVMRQIRWYWEHNVLIPNVNVRSNSIADDTEDLSDSIHTVTPNIAQETMAIDLRFNMLHQKLAMINCCIRRQQQIQKQKGQNTPSLSSVSSPLIKKKTYHNLFDEVRPRSSEEPNKAESGFNRFLERLVEGDDQPGMFPQADRHKSTLVPEDSSWDETMDIEEEDDEYFDSIEDVTPSNAAKLEGLSNRMDESFVQLDKTSSSEGVTKSDSEVTEDGDRNPQGRKSILKNSMLCNEEEPLWIPETQDIGFMTEDMVKQQAEVFESLGTSDDAAKIRAQLQSAHLLSDMQAFKAANPKAVFNDFVRWHSPKDWVTEGTDDGKPQLSARMAEAGNLWLELWQEAKPIPITKQKPLFNITMEGEKALHFLESMSVYEVFSFLLPTVALIAYDTLVSHPVTLRVPYLTAKVSQLAKDITKFPWDDMRQGRVSGDSIISSIREKEILICRANSLLRKVSGCGYTRTPHEFFMVVLNWAISYPGR